MAREVATYIEARVRMPYGQVTSTQTQEVIIGTRQHIVSAIVPGALRKANSDSDKEVGFDYRRTGEKGKLREIGNAAEGVLLQRS